MDDLVRILLLAVVGLGVAAAVRGLLRSASRPAPRHCGRRVLRVSRWVQGGLAAISAALIGACLHAATQAEPDRRLVDGLIWGLLAAISLLGTCYLLRREVSWDSAALYVTEWRGEERRLPWASLAEIGIAWGSVWIRFEDGTRLWLTNLQIGASELLTELERLAPHLFDDRG